MNEYQPLIETVGDSELSRLLIEGPNENSSLPSYFYDERITTISTYFFFEFNAFEEYIFTNVTRVNSHAFEKNTMVKKVSFPLCKTIDDSAFQGCTSLLEVNLPICTYIGETPFMNTQIKSLSLPECTNTGRYPFGAMLQLEFLAVPKIVNIPESCFSGNNTSLSQLDLPSVKTISKNGFTSLKRLKILNLGPNITSINSKAFDQYMSSDLVINIPKSEGEISGAPWGAPATVTINYDTPYAGDVPMPES